MPRIPNLRQLAAGWTYQQLQAMSRPAGASQPEILVDTLYDTQVFTKTSTTTLTFFAKSQSDKSLSNLDQGGSLPGGRFFVIYYIYVDAFPSDNSFMQAGSATASTGLLNDLGLLFFASLPRLLLTYNNKQYGPYPLTMFRGSGTLNGQVMATYTAPIETEWATNAISPDGGMALDGSLTLGPQQAFNFQIIWPAQVTTSTDYNVRLTLHGVNARPVQ